MSGIKHQDILSSGSNESVTWDFEKPQRISTEIAR